MAFAELLVSEFQIRGPRDDIAKRVIRVIHFHSSDYITYCTLFFQVFLKNTEEQISVCNLIVHTFFPDL